MRENDPLVHLVLFPKAEFLESFANNDCFYGVRSGVVL